MNVIVLSANLSSIVWKTVCFAPGIIISKCTSSERSKTSFFNIISDNFFNSSLVHTLPTGLCGEQNNKTLFLGS